MYAVACLTACGGVFCCGISALVCDQVQGFRLGGGPAVLGPKEMRFVCVGVCWGYRRYGEAAR